jgi:general secretion pathway protein J
LLVALAVLALVTVLLVQAITSARTWLVRLEERARDAAVEPAAAYMRRTLAEARALPIDLPSDSAQLLDGRADQLTLLTGHTPRGAVGGLHRLSWVLVPGARPGTFDLEDVRTLYRPRSTAEAPVRTTLLTGLRDITFSYFPRPGGTGAWSETWTDARELPALVAVEVRFPNGDRRRFPPLTVALGVGR